MALDNNGRLISAARLTKTIRDILLDILTGLRTKLLVLAGHVLRAARRIFGIPEFHFCTVADGIKEHLFGQKQSIHGYFPLILLSLVAA